MWKVAVKYGLICGTFLLLLFWMSYRLGSNPLVDPRHLFLDIFILSLFVFFSNKEFKSYKNEGILHFWQGMTLGFFTYLPAALVFGIGLFVFIKLSPDFMDDYKTQSLEFLESIKSSIGGINNEEFEEMNRKNANTTLWERIGIAIRNKIFTGVLVTPVIAIILRKKPN